MVIETKYWHPDLRWYHRLNPLWWFGNIDEPQPPSQFDGRYRQFWQYRWLRKLGVPHRVATAIWWGTRNPLHNFCYYTVGLAGMDLDIDGKDDLIDMFAPHGWHWLLVKWRRHPIVRLPYISYHDKEVKLYAGWGDSGQFGLELKGKRGPALVAWVLLCAVAAGLIAICLY